MADSTPDGRRNRMAESTSTNLKARWPIQCQTAVEAEWPNQHQAANPKLDGRINSRRPIQSRMAESTTGGRSEAGWPNQHHAADPRQDGRINIRRSSKPIGRPRLKANDRINIRRPKRRIGRSPKPSDRPDDWPRPNPGRGRTAGVRRPKTNGRSQTAEADARQQSSCRCPRQRLLKPAYRGAQWHYLHGVHYASAHANGY